MIVLLLLVGLWMMHGLSGTTDAGCHGAAMPLPMAFADAEPGLATMTAPMAGEPTAARAGGPSIGAGPAERMRNGEKCVSGQPPNPGQDLLALLALLALALAGFGTPGTAPARTTGRAAPGPRWRAPPGLFGIRLLTTVCVSRT